MSDFQTLIYEEHNGVGQLTVNRPEKLNALDATVLTELKTFFTEAAKKKLIGLIVTGSGEKAFVAGADIASMSKMTAAEAQVFGRLGHNVMTLVEYLPYPVIAAVNGFALGGGFELALACDFIFASQNAVFGLPEVKLGLIPGFGGTQRLARRTNPAIAKGMVFASQNLNATQAHDCGIANQIYADKVALLQGCREYLAQVAKNSPLAISIAKKIIDQGAQASLEQGLTMEVNAFAQLFSSHDMQEGTAAFLTKRPAQFKGV